MKAPVLLANDMDDIRKVIRLVLEDAGYDVSTAHGSAAAMGMLRTTPERMVVVVSTRCGTDLLEAAAREPEVGRHAFVLLTGCPETLSTTWQQILSALDVPVITCPFDLNTLYRTVAGAAHRVAVQEDIQLPAQPPALS